MENDLRDELQKLAMEHEELIGLTHFDDNSLDEETPLWGCCFSQVLE